LCLLNKLLLSRVGLLYIKPEVHDISVLYNIFLSFDPEFAVFAAGGFGSILDIVVVSDYFGLDKSFSKSVWMTLAA